MIYRLLADGAWLLHLASIVFVVAGGLFLLRRPRLSCSPWLNLPAVFPACHLSFCLESRVRPIALGLTAASYVVLLVHVGTKQELRAKSDNQLTKATLSE